VDSIKSMMSLVRGVHGGTNSSSVNPSPCARIPVIHRSMAPRRGREEMTMMATAATTSDNHTQRRANRPRPAGSVAGLNRSEGGISW